MKLKATVISTKRARELLSRGGPRWILFAGDEFDAGLYEKWNDYRPTKTEAKKIDKILMILSKLDRGEHALHVELV